MKKMRTVAISYARGGSKSVLNKNTMAINGKPLYSYNLQAALNTPWVESTWISTDIPEIVEKKVLDYEAGIVTVIPRPAELCTDSSHLYDAIKHSMGVVENESDPFDIYVLLLGNSMGAKASHITDAIDILMANWDRVDSVMSVSKFNMFNPFRAFSRKGNRLVPMIDPSIQNSMLKEGYTGEKNAFGDVWFFNGSFWVVKRETLVANSGKSYISFLGDSILPYEQSEGVMEIDAEWQIRNLLF